MAIMFSIADIGAMGRVELVDRRRAASYHPGLYMLFPQPVCEDLTRGSITYWLHASTLAVRLERCKFRLRSSRWTYLTDGLHDVRVQWVQLPLDMLEGCSASS